MKTCFLLLGVVACAFAQYETQSSGYGSNNAQAVQDVAKKSPNHKPVDYTKTSNDAPQKQSKVGNQVGNQIKSQQAGRVLTTKKNEQKSKQNKTANLTGGNQNAKPVSGSESNNKQKTNQNVVNNVGQSNKNVQAVNVAQHVGLKDAPPSYQPNTGGSQPNYGDGGDQGGTNIFGSKFHLQTLGQVSTQGQGNFQQGGGNQKAKTVSGSESNNKRNTNQNVLNNVGQSNKSVQPVNVAQHVGLKDAPPSYQPSYGGSGDQGGANIFGNKLDLQTLGQVSTQGQGNFQQGGAQTNAGFHQNVGQTNNQNVGGISGSYRLSYDAPSYDGNVGSGGVIIIPILPSYGGVEGPGSNVVGNKFDLQTLGQTNTQGQQNLKQGGAQTNVGSNTNAVNVGQQNNQGGPGAGYKPSYDAPSYGGSEYAGGAIYIPDFSNFLKNNVYSQNLGQASNQGQSNYQQGGAQANFGVNTNEVNVGQTNNQNAGGKDPSYDAPKYGGYPPSGYDKNPSYNVIGNKFKQQNLGQNNQQGQSSAQIGGAQTNVGQTNNQNVGGSGRYNKGYDATKYRPAPEPENPYRH
ncbi:hypothetical protein ANCCAN_05905 [Ancylostoma caninum]|uniref:Uncharacterized protein n=1 Tax=Ancylostoma caninum TaxID=29170 RepID=A0A368GXK8_ANCCA|nr:hypothetical protein ANCCAN_05905 [Ancylostoma caninum]